MNRILELTQKRNAAAEAAKLLNEKAATEKRSLTPDEQESFDRMYSEIQDYSTQIRTQQRTDEIEGIVETSRDQRSREHPGSGSTDQQAEEFRSSFVQFLRRGDRGMSAEQRSHLVPGSENDYAFQVPASQRSVQSELSGALGGYIVPQGFWANVIDALKFYGGILEAGPTVISTSMGNDLPVPTSNDTVNIGRELSESSPVTQTAIPFSQVVLKAYKYSSDIILVPIELLQDSGVDIEAFIVKQIATRLGRILNLRFTTGSGTNQPQGVVNGAALGLQPSGETAAIAYNDIIDLKYSVNKAYRNNAKWMTSDAMLKLILKLVDDNHRPLILDYLRTLQAGEPESLLGQPIIINNDMATPTNSAKTLLYGDFTNYWVRRVMNMLMRRLDERYADVGQVGFLAFMRADGRMVDAGTNPIKYFQQTD